MDPAEKAKRLMNQHCLDALEARVPKSTANLLAHRRMLSYQIIAPWTAEPQVGSVEFRRGEGSLNAMHVNKCIGRQTLKISDRVSLIEI